MLPVFIMPLLGMARAYIITLTDGSFAKVSGAETTYFAGIQIMGDGTFLEINGGSNTDTVQHAATTDWIIPNIASTRGFHVQCVPSGSSVDGGSAAINTWLAVSTDPKWFYSDGGGQPKTGTWDINISDDGGSTTLATENYDVVAVK